MSSKKHDPGGVARCSCGAVARRLRSCDMLAIHAEFWQLMR